MDLKDYSESPAVDAHTQDVVHVTGNAHQAETHQQGKDGGRDCAGVVGKPQENARLHVDGEQGHVGRHGEYKGQGNGSADDANDEGGDHCHLVATEGGLLVLADVLHSIEPAGECCHEAGLVVEMWFLGEEQFLECFVFVHSFSLAFSLSRPRESCFFTASSEASVMAATSLMS